MKTIVNIDLDKDGSLVVEVTPIVGLVFDSKEEVFDSFDSEVIVNEVQKLLNAVGKKMGITEFE